MENHKFGLGNPGIFFSKILWEPWSCSVRYDDCALEGSGSSFGRSGNSS